MTKEHFDLSDLLKDRDVILMAAWTLPNEGPLTPDERKQAMANFHQYIRLHNLTASAVGHQVGSPKQTLITELIKGVYREGADAHIRTLNNWIEQHARQRKAEDTSRYVETKVALEIQHVARLVRENQTMGLVTGPSGIGKTRCAVALHETVVGSIMVTAGYDSRHPKGLIGAIAKELGVRTVASSSHAQQNLTQLERVRAKLKGGARMLIIDEAHKLYETTIELLREVHDSTGAPVFLLAVKDLDDRIEASADPDHGQICSRFEITRPLSEGRDLHADGKPMFTIDEIKQLYQQPPIRLSGDAAHYLRDVANELGRGSLRKCRTLVRNAARRARKRQGKTDDQSVTITADDLAYVERLLKPAKINKEAVNQRRRRVQTAATA